MAVNGYAIIDCTPYHPFVNNTAFVISESEFNRIKSIYEIGKPVLCKNIDDTPSAYGSIYKSGDTSYKVGCNARSNNSQTNYLLWYQYNDEENRYEVTVSFGV